MRLYTLLLGSVLTLFSFAQYPTTIETEKVYVSTDKFYYENSENIDFAVFISTDSSFHPISTRIKVWLENAQGQTLDSVFIYASETYRCGYLNRQPKGGQYFVKAQSVHQLNYAIPKVYSKEIFVQQYQKTSFLINLNTQRDNYYGFDSIDITATVFTSTERKLEGLPLTLSLIADGKILQSKTIAVDAAGKAELKLPLSLATANNVQWKASCDFAGKTYQQIRTTKLKPEKVVTSVYYHHGNNGWISGVESTLTIATTDPFGNPLDVTGELVSQSDTIRFRSIAKGLAEVRFKPFQGDVWKLICGEEVVELEAAGKPVGIGRNKDFFFPVGDVHKDYELVFSGRDQVFQRQWVSELESVRYNHSLPGTYCVTLLLNDTVVAQRVFLDYKTGSTLDLKSIKETVAKSDFKKLSFSTENKKAFYGSLSLVDINAFNQIEDKSHNVASWLLLGSEFNTYIDEPQYYFKDDKSSTKCLELLLATLTSAYSRDWKTGKTKAIESHRYQSKVIISGTVYDNNQYRYRTLLKNARIHIKNTSINGHTDSVGKFSLEIPATIQAPFTLEVRKWGEIATLQIESISKLQAVHVSLAQKKKDYVLNAEDLKGLTKVDLNKTENNINFLGSRADGTAYFVDGVRVVGSANQASYSYAEIERLPTRSINAMAATTSAVTVRSFNYRYFPDAHIYNNYSFPSTYFSYSTPFSIQVDYQRIRPPYSSPIQYNKNTTAYWNATLKSTSKGSIDLGLNGAINGGMYKLIIEGIDEGGDPVYASKDITVLDELTIDLALPQNLRLGDELNLPYSITNNTNEPQEVVVYWRLKQSFLDTILLKPKQSFNGYHSLNGLGQIEKIYARVDFKTSSFSKHFGQVISVATDREVLRSILSGNTTNSTTLDISAAEMSSLSAHFEFFPIFSDRIIEVSKNLVRQPTGCFEQVSSSNYPNLMVYKLLRATNTSDQALLDKTKRYIQSAYQKLVNYQTSLGGFEWYGNTPPHQALTAYGLLQFHLMKEMQIQIDDKMFDNNLKWLLRQRDNQGGFKNNQGKYGFRAAPYETNNAYITWVLSRISNIDLTEQLKAIEEDVNQEFDAYKLALLCNAYLNRSEREKAATIYKKLVNHLNQQQYQNLQATSTIVYSYGNARDLEICALALFSAMAMEDQAVIEAMKSKILSSVNSRGYFGNTQATALCLEVLTELSLKENKSNTSVYDILMNGELISSVNPQVSKQNSFSIPVEKLKQGINEVEVKTEGVTIPFKLEVNWLENQKKLKNSEIDLNVAFIHQNNNHTLEIVVANRLNKAKPQLVASIDIPDGYAFETEVLRNWVKKKEVDYYELDSGKLNLYFLETGPLQERSLTLNLNPVIPGKYNTIKHELFEYYHPETVCKVYTPVVHLKKLDQ